MVAAPESGAGYPDDRAENDLQVRETQRPKSEAADEFHSGSVNGSRARWRRRGRRGRRLKLLPTKSPFHAVIGGLSSARRQSAAAQTPREESRAVPRRRLMPRPRRLFQRTLGLEAFAVAFPNGRAHPE